ncbi:MAG: RNA methyltransferase [Spirochaetaceae bacterium]
MKHDTESGAQVVLARPTGSRNVGAICRAMKSMGITRLVIVPPERSDYCERIPPVSRVDAEVMRNTVFDRHAVEMVAVHSADVYAQCRFAATLEEAVQGSAAVVGFTRRSGRFRHTNRFTPRTLAEHFASMRSGLLSLVFGNEKSGLSTTELAVCTMSCEIPSAPDQGSLNLSHAVQIACYEVFQAGARQSLTDAIPLERVDTIADYLYTLLEDIGALELSVPEETRMYLRSILSRSLLNDYEATKLHKMLRKLRHMKMKAAPGANADPEASS